jgi:hypothetical protein
MSDHFRDRYAVRRFDDGGIVVDLATGSYSRLNRSAASICEALLVAGSITSARRLIGEELRLNDAEVTMAIDHVLASLEFPGPRLVRPDPFVYELSADRGGYALLANGSPKVWVSSNGLTIRWVANDRPGVVQTSEYLRAIAPRLLFLTGEAVIHGAACQAPNRSFAVCGDSGAGKTTTARAFDRVGARLFAEDMLVIASPSPLTVHSGGEEAIRKWALESAEHLLRRLEIETSGIQAALDGMPIPVSEIWRIAANQRAEGARVLSRRLGTTDGALAVMTSLFLGATTLPEWRRFLELAATIAMSTSVFEARLPQGLDRLQEAAELYARNSTW